MHSKLGDILINLRENTLWITVSNQDDVKCFVDNTATPMGIMKVLVTDVQNARLEKCSVEFALAMQIEIKNLMAKSGGTYPQWVLDVISRITPNIYSNKMFTAPGTFTAPNAVMTLKQLQDVCDHKWKTYQGFSRDFLYCVHCDRKKEF